MQIGFIKALMQHTKLDSESLTDFRNQYSRLSDEDKAWFKERFTIEYGYTFNE